MTLCVNQSGTWREITTQCVNDSGTWREVATGCINNSGTWRKYGFLGLGDAYEGGYLIARCSSTATHWIVAPSNSEVSRCWYCRDDASTRAQQVSGCTGWFVPTSSQLINPGFFCKIYWDSYNPTTYWSSTQKPGAPYGCTVNFNCTDYRRAGRYDYKSSVKNVRAFRCVTY